MQTPTRRSVLWGENIRKLREKARLSQSGLGKLIDVDQTTVSKWERGLSTPTDDHKDALARELGRKPHTIFPL